LIFCCAWFPRMMAGMLKITGHAMMPRIPRMSEAIALLS
jgi:hypothetical protein